MTENELTNKMNLEYAADNLPFLLKKIIVGMPIRISGDEKQLLEIATQFVRDERDRRNNVGRPRRFKTEQEKIDFFNAKRKKGNQKLTDKEILKNVQAKIKLNNS